MEIVRITKQHFLAFVDRLIAERRIEVIGPVEALGGRFSFEPLDAAASLRLDFDETSLSPRKFLLPLRDRFCPACDRQSRILCARLR